MTGQREAPERTQFPTRLGRHAAALAVVGALTLSPGCGENAQRASPATAQGAPSPTGTQTGTSPAAGGGSSAGATATGAQPAAENCTHRARLTALADFFAGWSTGKSDAMRVAFFGSPAPWGLRLPRRPSNWPREVELPRTHDVPDVRAWLARRVAAGDRVALFHVTSSMVQPGVTGGTLTYRRSAPDIRDGHRLYGIAKFEVTCQGVSALSGGRSWWRVVRDIRLCAVGREFRGARICGVLPNGSIGR
jgi:hypothetical protein